MNVRNYQVMIRALDAEEGGGYVAHVPDLPGCMSDGSTPGEAIVNAYDAIACWMEAADEMKRPVPSPSHMIL